MSWCNLIYCVCFLCLFFWISCFLDIPTRLLSVIFKCSLLVIHFIHFPQFILIREKHSFLNKLSNIIFHITYIPTVIYSLTLEDFFKEINSLRNEIQFLLYFRGWKRKIIHELSQNVVNLPRIFVLFSRPLILSSTISFASLGGGERVMNSISDPNNSSGETHWINIYILVKT